VEDELVPPEPPPDEPFPAEEPDELEEPDEPDEPAAVWPAWALDLTPPAAAARPLEW
jgi:hypothetical protein